MRKGKILSINASNGRGLIEDDNQQEIEFYLSGLVVKVSDEVSFDIAMGVGGLIAVDLILL